MTDFTAIVGETLSVVSAPTTQTPNIAFFQAEVLGSDVENGGTGRIYGTVKRDAVPDVPVYRRVRLHRMDGLPIREAWSDAVTGEYTFNDLSLRYKYYVVAFDHTHDKRAVIADNLTPEPMP